jgi:hypothetical protein
MVRLGERHYFYQYPCLFFSKPIFIALFSSRRAFRGYGVAGYNRGYFSSSGTLVVGGNSFSFSYEKKLCCGVVYKLPSKERALWHAPCLDAFVFLTAIILKFHFGFHFYS